jgi:hypothetical protein
MTGIFFMKDKFRKSVLWFAAVLVFLALMTFLVRNPVLNLVIQKKISRFNAEHNAILNLQKVRIQGISSVSFNGLTLKPGDGDSLLRIDSSLISVNPLKLLAGRISVTALRIENMYVTISRKDSITNYDFLLKRRRPQESMGSSRPSDTVGAEMVFRGGTDYNETARRLFRLIFDKIPLSMEVANLNIRSVTGKHEFDIHVDTVNLKDREFSTQVFIHEDSLDRVWKAGGDLDNGRRHIRLELRPADRKRISLPYIGFKWNAACSFDSLSFSLSAGPEGRDAFGIRGRVAWSGLQVYHEKIARDTVSAGNLGIDYAITFRPDAIELDSATRISFNMLDFNPYFKYKPYPSEELWFRIHKPQFPAQSLFASLPEGLFTNLRGIQTTGKLSYHLDFHVDLGKPDSLKFEMELKRQQFRVLSYGNGTLLKLDSAFLYTAYEDGEAVRTFTVGPGNPNFRRLDQISPYLQYAVMTSEDGGFYLHRGFLPDAFRESIITNIKEGRFVRGGSTISMQLVKNVFLSRNKTIARKLEEALIVWLIENQEICSKQRMYEVYLNIIEWGPLIYGANEASRFYFNKDASKLTLAEAIFMASIIPRPKWFKYNFDVNGHLRPSMAEYYRLVSAKMLAKGWITQEESDHIVPDVELRGPAKLALKRGAVVDSLPEDIPGENEE